jgi:MoaA/NifB/PqqE/SkfB family radical SAM enzyme
MNNNLEREIDPINREESLGIEVTTDCNSNCSHCFARAGISERLSLPVGFVKDIIAEGYNSAYRHLHITGGEPLLWNGLFETLDYAFAVGYETVFLNTNGTLLTEDISTRLAAYPGLSISVSLEGPQALHDRFRGKGSYKRVLVCIEKAIKADIDLFIFTTACKSLIQDFTYFVDKIYKDFPPLKGLFIIQLIRVIDDFFDLSYELIDPHDFIKLVRMISFSNICGLRVGLLNNPLACVVSKLLELPWVQSSVPLHRPGRIIVLASRDIALAHSSRDSIGRYVPGMISRVLASDKYRNAVAPDKTICPSCNYVKHCAENAMVRPSKWFRDMHSESPYCKRVLDMTTLLAHG